MFQVIYYYGNKSLIKDIKYYKKYHLNAIWELLRKLEKGEWKRGFTCKRLNVLGYLIKLSIFLNQKEEGISNIFVVVIVVVVVVFVVVVVDRGW